MALTLILLIIGVLNIFVFNNPLLSGFVPDGWGIVDA